MQANINCLVPFFGEARRRAHRRRNAFRCCFVSSRFMLVLWDKIFLLPPLFSLHGWRSIKKMKMCNKLFYVLAQRHYAHGGWAWGERSFIGFSSLTRNRSSSQSMSRRALGMRGATEWVDLIHGACRCWIYGRRSYLYEFLKRLMLSRPFLIMNLSLFWLTCAGA